MGVLAVEGDDAARHAALDELLGERVARVQGHRVVEAVEKTYNKDADIPASAATYSMAGGAREITPG